MKNLLRFLLVAAAGALSVFGVQRLIKRLYISRD